MDKVFAIGDVHGKLGMLEKMLKQWNPDNQQLILLGDLIDRGENSYGVLQLAQKLQEEYGAVVLKGNHESMLLNWLEEPEQEYRMYFPQGGRETLQSFFNKDLTYKYIPTYLAEKLQSEFPKQIEFMKKRPHYFEWNQYLFVHAGVNLDLKDWKNTNEHDFYWIRRPFHFGKNETGKTIVFGHTITSNLNSNFNSDIWVSPCKSKIGIDGGAVFDGQLHGLAIDSDGIIVHSVDNELNINSKPLNLELGERVILPY